MKPCDTVRSPSYALDRSEWDAIASETVRLGLEGPIHLGFACLHLLATWPALAATQPSKEDP